jgi:hypothetical protein
VTVLVLVLVDTVVLVLGVVVVVVVVGVVVVVVGLSVDDVVVDVSVVVPGDSVWVTVSVPPVDAGACDSALVEAAPEVTDVVDVELPASLPVSVTMA